MCDPNSDWNKPIKIYFDINKKYKYTLVIKLYQRIIVDFVEHDDRIVAM